VTYSTDENAIQNGTQGDSRMQVGGQSESDQDTMSKKFLSGISSKPRTPSPSHKRGASVLQLSSHSTRLKSESFPVS
jgi:hypothetical protein